MRQLLPLLIALALGTGITLAPYGDAQQPPAGPARRPFAPFEDYIRELERTTPEQYAARHQVPASKEAVREMHAHLRARYQGVRVTQSFQGRSGHVIDCIPVQQQPALKHPALRGHQVQAPPPAPTPPSSGTASDLPKPRYARVRLQGERDASGRPRTCPAGCIPVRRVDMEEMSRYASLRQFQRKHPKGGGHPLALPEADAQLHRYVCGAQQGRFGGGGSWLSVWQPTPAADQFSLSQQWFVGGSGSNLQTVEAGWQVYPDKYGHNRPVLFTYWTADGYNQTGCYSLDGPGFVQTSNQYVLGGALDEVSVPGGQQVGFALSWHRDPHTGNWWLYIDDGAGPTALGYFPRELFGSGPLSRQAGRVDFGGEVTGTPVSLQMGSGALAAAGYGKAAFHKEIFVCPAAGGTHWATLVGQQTNPQRYTLSLHNGSKKKDWDTYFFFGGARCP